MLRFPSVMNKRILILVALVTVLFTGKTILDIFSDRKQVVISSERLSRGFASALNEHAIRTFSNAENTLDTLIRDIRRLPRGGISRREERFHRLLASHKSRSPVSPLLFVVAGDGRLGAASSEYPVRKLDLSDSEYFRFHMKSPAGGVFISRPLNSRLTGSRQICLTKRISNPDGTLAMVVAISVDPLYFSDFYRTIELGKHDRIFLFRRDGATLALEPFNEKFMDRSFPSYRLIGKEWGGNAHAGTFRMKDGTLDGTRRIVSYRFSDSYPVVSVISLREHDMLARWRIRSIKSAGGAFLLMALVGTLGLLVYLQIRELKQSEDKYSLIATTANEGLWMLDAESRITYVNPRVADMFGYQPEEMIGRPIGSFMCQDELQDHEERMRLRRQGVSERYERRFRHRDGAEVWTVVSAAALMDEEEGYQGVVAMCLNVTDRKKSEQRQARLEKELRQAHKMEAVGILAGGMAHDFNNLLQSITAYVFLAKMSIAPDEEAQEYLHEAEKIANQASELGQRLLILSKGGVTLLRAASLPPLILSQVEPILEGTSVAGKFELPEDMPLVTIDEALIIQVISHLATNAVENMPQGGVLRISGRTMMVSSKHELPIPAGEYVLVSFSDTGDGIPAANLPKIFDPYFSTKESRTEKGIGLSLALCHTIIRKHKGMITASSLLGKGTTISFYLPVAGDETASPLFSRCQ